MDDKVIMILNVEPTTSKFREGILPALKVNFIDNEKIKSVIFSGPTGSSIATKVIQNFVTTQRNEQGSHSTRR